MGKDKEGAMNTAASLAVFCQNGVEMGMAALI